MSIFSIDARIARAKTLHTDFYTNPSYFEAAKERIFAPSWQFIGDTDSVPTPHSVYPFTLLPHFLDEPLVLTNNTDTEIHCLSNVCTHRGNLVATAPCVVKQLRCGYHGRKFALDGAFVSMPEFQEVENFPCEADDLAQIPLLQWGKLLFANLEPHLSEADFFGDMQARMNWFPMEDLVFRADLSQDYEVNAHWALYCENYLEGFHIPFVHAELNAVLDFGNYTTEIFKYSNLQLGIGNEGDICFDLPPSSPDFGKNVAAYYWWVFPNMMFNFYPWGLSFNLVQPISPTKTKVSFLVYVSDESKLGQGAGSGLDTVELEDEAVVEQVQLGIRSRFYQHGRYSVRHEKGTHHFHGLIADFMA